MGNLRVQSFGKAGITLTHIPTGLVETCNATRSRARNRLVASNALLDRIEIVRAARPHRFPVGVTYTDLRPRWVLVARGHVRGCEAVSLKFNNINDMVAASSRLRGIGYTLIRTFPEKD